MSLLDLAFEEYNVEHLAQLQVSASHLDTAFETLHDKDEIYLILWKNNKGEM